jgi:hypothetical protein
MSHRQFERAKMLRSKMWLYLLSCLSLAGCEVRQATRIPDPQKSAESKERASEQFRAMIAAPIANLRLDELRSILCDCFVRESNAAEYDALLKTATRHRKSQIYGESADEYIWELEDGLDGITLHVYVHGDPPRIFGTNVVEWIK